ncbi:MAG TPA: GGDEF domain-containing protein, partial [Pseudorhizobium sp.]|nr:GGDEF domain-containing protein [Pseudorhizobium sp.]
VDSYVAVPALIWIGGMLLPFVREDFASRVVLYHSCACIGFAILIALLLRHRDRSTWPRRILAAILTIHIATSLLTAALTALSGATSFASTPSPSLLLLPGAFCFLALVLIGAQMIAAKSEQRLMDLVLTDPLTGVLNRRGLIEEFGRLRRESRPDKPMIALLQFDLDNFKHINDSHGHQCGDTVLIAFCRLASISLKGRGSFGRMGGEEFASILQVSDLVEAASIAEGLRMTLALQTISAGDRQVKVTVSTGISLQTAAVADLDRLLTGADRALYAAKSAGRNRTAVEQGGVASIVPSAAMLSPREMALEIHATEQVTALRHLTLVGAN